MLHDDRARGQLLTMAHVAKLECHEVASAGLAVDTKVEERELANPTFYLKAHSQRPDVFYSEGHLLPR